MAIRTALAEADGEISVIHDADLEYHPKDLLRIVKVFVEEQADAVFGSRFAGGEARRALLFRHELGNRLLTFLTNWVTNVNLTDMETCYKAVRTDLLKSIPLRSNDFRMEPELTIKLAKREARIFEVPISYSGRTYQEGKKINWRDGLKALWAILRFWLTDEIYAQDAYGSQILSRLARAPRFNAWMADTIRPFCGQKVLEIGSGTGNLTRRLIPRGVYVASDINPLYLQSLRSLTADRPYLDVTLTDVTEGQSFPKIEGGFDTVVCLNVIEHVDDDKGALENVRAVLVREGPRHRARAAWAGALRHARRDPRAQAALHRGDAPRARGGERVRGEGGAALQPRRHRGVVAQRQAPQAPHVRAPADRGAQRAHADLPARGLGAPVAAAVAHRGARAGRRRRRPSGVPPGGARAGAAVARGGVTGRSTAARDTRTRRPA